ncbi:glycosyl transferase [Bacterioplanes sanyensis]|uniref:glycosyltransferase family 4 protein n=1 Tax=Bacterioplanes sanyensis TaxID=1249553 RepID=UPI001671D2E7|nr:glycosyltransferase family 1 protein [Bacterioplanes sanyensis]GGY38375.1 glycosyl transferase [Bacterioplanes sanyensis]
MPLPISRISIITETFAPEINGVANTLSHLVNGLMERGVQVQVIRPRQAGETPQTLTSLPWQTVTLPGLPIPGYQGLRFGLPWQGRIRKALQDFQPQAVYVATEGPMGWAAIRAAQTIPAPVISGFHTNFHQYIEHYRLGALEPWVYAYLRRFHNRTHATLVPTHSQRDELEQHGFRHVQVMSRGVDSQRFHPAKRDAELRRQWQARDDDLVLLYVGRIASEKNLQLAIRTYQHLKALDERVKLVLVGDGPELHSLREQHADVICCGMQTGEALARHYASGDVFLFPSKTDTFGNVVTEAMASGLAVVSFDYAAAHQHIRHGSNGLLAPFGDEDAFIQQASIVPDSPNLLRGLRQNARQHAEGISWDSIVDDFLQRLSLASYEANHHATEQDRPTKDRPPVQQSGSL